MNLCKFTQIVYKFYYIVFKCTDKISVNLHELSVNST